MKNDNDHFEHSRYNNPPITQNLIAWYALDGDLADVHGGHDAELVVGNISFGPDRLGRHQGALVLDGTAGLIMKGIAIHDRSFSLQFWTLNPQKWILGQGIGADGQGLHIGVGSAGMRCDYWGNDLIAPLGNSFDWTHWVMTHDIDSQTKSTWRNGECVAQMQSAPYAGRGDFTMGRHFSGGGFYTGSLDDVAIWDKALTEAEIMVLYGKGS